MLDQHADTLEGDVKPPLVILGAEGVYFSASLYCLYVAQEVEKVHCWRIGWLNEKLLSTAMSSCFNTLWAAQRRAVNYRTCCCD